MNTIEIDGENPRFNCLLINYLFLPRETQRNENKFLIRRLIYNGNSNIVKLHLFSIRKYLGHLTYFFNFIIQVLFMSRQCRIPIDFFILGCVLKPEVIEGAFRSRKPGHFSFHWMNVVWAQVFMITEISCNKWWKQKLGTY